MITSWKVQLTTKLLDHTVSLKMEQPALSMKLTWVQIYLNTYVIRVGQLLYGCNTWIIKIIFYTRAQRTLHLTSIRNKLLYFIAAGHHQFAKGARLTLWLYDVWRQQYFDLVKKFFVKGLHTVRYSSRNWSGIWSDMSIEHRRMRETKTSGESCTAPFVMKTHWIYGFISLSTQAKLAAK